ncbi:DUF2490 domain-containing protein [Tamlana sp. I1]|uniref:DUF2490 domain-containing protein n=1 Tax=Tamlana sp. I1 TaxID=2762061 RepID=UPI001890787C|nr:DUF2490 domain-containing protein [Tamlana sp. I1]
MLSFKRINILILMLYLCSFTGQAQNTRLGEESSFTEQFWLSLDPSWQLKDSTYLKIDIGYRTVNSDGWQRYIARGGYEKQIKPFVLKHLERYESYIGGVGLFYFDNNQGYNSFEIRPFQGYRLGFNVSKRIQLSNYFRLEERFLITQDPNNNHFGLRLRYQIIANFGLQGFLFGDERGFYFPMGVEFFYNIVELSQFSDVVRITPGAGYQFDPSFKIQGMLAYHYTRQEDLGGLSKTNDIVFRIKVIKSF